MNVDEYLLDMCMVKTVSELVFVVYSFFRMGDSVMTTMERNAA